MDLSTTYLGIKLPNPLVPSASPLCRELDNIKRMEDAGASAVVLHSLFEEQIATESHDLHLYLFTGTDCYPEAESYFPDLTSYNMGPDLYLEHIRQVKESVSIPVIGSLNGVSSGGWIRYAREIQDAGADALELNIFFLPTDVIMEGMQVESMLIDLVREIRGELSIPLAVKLSPFYSSIPSLCSRVAEAGADALVLFNRFYQPDLDIEQLEVIPDLQLSNPTELRLRLRWVGVLFGEVDADLAVTGGVHSARDVVKCMMAGANVAMMTSALLRSGIGHLTTVLDDLKKWMEENEYESIQLMRGSMSRRNVADPASYARANYMKVLNSYAANAPSLNS